MRLPGWLLPPSTGARRQADRWLALPHPVPGHSSIDGLPVPVVAVRRNVATGQLEVVRGLRQSAGSPADAGAPARAQRHSIPASSFIPHPRRELIIDGQRFVFSTVAPSVSCATCAKDALGFAFCSSDVPLSGATATPSARRTLCEPCAERQARKQGG
jgi:hypothetical protein